MKLPDIRESELNLNQRGILFRRPIAPELHLVSEWVKINFSAYWASEVQVAFAAKPISCLIAQQDNEIIGFACYDTTARGFFGPTGTKVEERGKGIGKILIVKALEALKEMGFAYAIIGGVGPVTYYEQTVGAKLIEGSEINIYEHLIRKK
jgi:GNAT superfamily N-acetyltransferase